VVVTVVAVVVVAVTDVVQMPSSALHRPGQFACSSVPCSRSWVQSEGVESKQYGAVSATPLQLFSTEVVEDVDVLVVIVVVVVSVVVVGVVVVVVVVVDVMVCVVVVVVDVVSSHATPQVVGHKLFKPNTSYAQSSGFKSKQDSLSFLPLQVTLRGSIVVDVVGLGVVVGASHVPHLTGQRSLTSFSPAHLAVCSEHAGGSCTPSFSQT